jgi:hypothetical protein
MLEAYFVKPTTIDRIRACWIGAEVERYMIWLDEQGYRPRSVLRRVPMLVAFGEFAYARGARSVQDLPEHVEPFVRQWLARSRSERAGLAKEVRGPVEQYAARGTSRFRRHGPSASWRAVRRVGARLLRLPRL